MSVSYYIQYRLHGSSGAWSVWPSDALTAGDLLTSLTTVVGQNPPGPPLVQGQSYDFQVVAVNAAGSTTSNTITATATAGLTINSIVLSPSSPTFTAGAAVGTTIGTVSVGISSGTFNGTLTVGGTDAAFFVSPIVSGNLQLATNTTTARPYSFTIVATETGVSNSGFSQTFGATASAPVTESIEGTIVSTGGPIIYASKTTGQASTGPFNTFALTGSPFQITINGGSPTSSNVSELVYHNHTVFQWQFLSGVVNAWSYYNTTTSSWVNFAITAGPTLSTTSYPQSIGAGQTIGTISVTMSDASTFNGAYSVSDTANFQISGSTLQAKVALGAGPYSFTITATPNIVGNAVTSSTITLTQAGSTESASNTVFTTASPGTIYASSTAGLYATGTLMQAQLTAGGTISINGTDTGITGAAMMIYYNSIVTYKDGSQNWWMWNTVTSAWQQMTSSKPGITNGNSVVINGVTVTATTGQTGTYANLINPINSAGIPGVTASLVASAQTPNNVLVLTSTSGPITLAAGTTASGTNVLTFLGLPAGTYGTTVYQGVGGFGPVACTSIAAWNTTQLYVNQTNPGGVAYTTLTPASSASITTGTDAASFTAENDANFRTILHLSAGTTTANRNYTFGLQAMPNNPSLVGSRTGGPWTFTPIQQVFQGVLLSNGYFIGSSTVAVPVGKISAIVNGGNFLGSYALSGTNASLFSIGGRNNNILYANIGTGLTSGSPANNAYSVTITASQSNITTASSATFTLNSVATTDPNAWICTPPPDALANGQTVLAFYDDFVTSSQIVVGSGSQVANPFPATRKWYSDGTTVTLATNATNTDVTTSNVVVNTGWTPYDSNMTAQGVTATAGTNNGGTGLNNSPAGGIVRLQGGSSNSTILTVSEGFISLPQVGVFSQAYYEGCIQFQPANTSTASQTYGWPAMWAWSAENMRGHGPGGSYFSAGYTEIDMMEYAQFPTGAWGGAGYHGTGPGGTTWGVGGGWPDANWHIYGWQWRPNNSVQFYKDNVAQGTPGTAPTQLQAQHIFLMIGSGVTYATQAAPFTASALPIYVDWIRIWEQP